MRLLKPQRILLIPASYPPVLGGLQAVAHALAKHMTESGHELRVVTNRYPRSLQQTEIIDGVSVRRLTFLNFRWQHLLRRRPDLFLASAYYYPTVKAYLTQLMAQYRPSTVNIHFPDVQVPVMLRLKRRFPFHLVVSLHGDDVERWHRKDTRGNPAPLKEILRRADAVTACSRYLLQQAIKLVPEVEEKGVVIHNGVDPERFKDEAVYPHPHPYVLAHGRLTYRKGFDLLIEAWAASGAAESADLLIAGEGEEKEALWRRVSALGLQESVHFLGRASSAKVIHLLNGSRLVVVPSRQESFGIAALEALAAGKPLLATRVGGLVEFAPQSAPEGYCVLVAPTVDGLAQGLRAFLSQSRRMPTVPIHDRSVLRTYSWANTLTRYRKLLV